MKRQHIKTDENFKVTEVIEIDQRAHERAKVEKIGGTNRGNRMVKNRQKIEASENQTIFRIDRADRQRENRRNKRRK